MLREFTGIGCGLLLIGATASAGGWAVVTVKQLPDYVVADTLVTLTFAVRVHGMALTDGLNARVEARSQGLVVKALASPTSETGHYRATFTLPRKGDWTLAIDSGHGANSTRHLPLTVIGPRERAPVVHQAARGQRLFTAKGCVTCHAHAAVDPHHSSSIGPPLTGKRYEAAWLRQQLANPPRSGSRRAPDWEMPDLDLSDREIASLAAFINRDTEE